jgi:hypothetical protein
MRAISSRAEKRLFDGIVGAQIELCSAKTPFSGLQRNVTLLHPCSSGWSGVSFSSSMSLISKAFKPDGILARDSRNLRQHYSRSDRADEGC